MFKRLLCFLWGHKFREKRYTGNFASTYGHAEQYKHKSDMFWDWSHHNSHLEGKEYTWYWYKSCPKCGKNLPWNNQFAEETTKKMEQSE